MELQPFLLLNIQFLLLFFTFSFPHQATSRTPTNITDLESLLAFKAQLSDPYGLLATNWTTNTSFCSWVGVSCSQRRQRVTAIKLRDLPLQGTISWHLANLSFLSVLDLGNCTLRGSIPQVLGWLPRLKKLLLQDNSLSGSIPSGIFNMSSLITFSVVYNNLTGSLPSNSSFIMPPHLQFISLSVNQLTGEIPAAFSECRGLQTFSLSQNEFTGAIPAELSSLSELSVLQLGRNQLTGMIPTSLGNLTKLTSLDLSLNRLEGVIPQELGNLLNLQQISLSLNQLTGEIPSSFGQCKDLQILSLSFNQLNGTIPDKLGNLSELTLLYLANNTLTGTIPTSLGNLTNVIKFDLSFNNLEGVIPKELGNLPNLQYLNLGPNSLTGSIPSSFLNASMLTFLQLTSNNLTGHIPATLGMSMPLLTKLFINANQFTGGLDFITSLSNCRDLVFLDMSRNEFKGILPNSFGNLSLHLYYFSAGGNNLQGEIPTTLGNLSGLLFLDLSVNELVGPIPLDIAKLERLQILDLDSNRISGLVPSKLGLMGNLGMLFLQKNKFIGPIPDSIGNISQLQHLSLSTNRLSATIPMSLWNLRNLIELNLSQNMLHGLLPPQVGNLKALDVLDLSVNRLSGNISYALGQLMMLTHLDLSNNLFQGGIPQSLGALVNVKYLNLSHNFLLGPITKSIGNLPFISSLDLSFNELEGQIPEGRVFSNLTIPSLEGNVALCGAPQLHFPPCFENDVTSHSRIKLHSLKYILPVIASIMVVLASLCLLLAVYRRRTVSNIAHMDLPGLDDSRMVSYLELVRATDNFNQANLIGRGSFGSVYRGCLDDGLIVAVKVLNLEVEGASKSFLAECRALSIIRHRNLIKIISICSNHDFKALVLEFMPNRSLDQWLYSTSHCFNLLQRLNIMVDVSLALEYLHHHHPHIVLHCDLKPSNVLLDEEMIAHVSDFGIAKLLVGDGKSVASTSTPGTIGYIAPEFGSMGTVSRMCDVYSYGILLLETFTGKKPTDATFDGETNLREWICKAHPDASLDIVDPNLLKDTSSKEDVAAMNQCLSSVIELGLLCSKSSPMERIPMTDVVPGLQKIKSEYTSKVSTASSSSILST